MSNALFLIEMPNDFEDAWIQGLACLNLAQDVIDRYNIQFCDKLIPLYVRRKRVVVTVERDFIAPVINMRGKSNWSVLVSEKLILIETPEVFYQDELDFLTAKKKSFISNMGAASDDKFGKSKENLALLKRYEETEPKRIGF